MKYLLGKANRGVPPHKNWLILTYAADDVKKKLSLKPELQVSAI